MKITDHSFEKILKKNYIFENKPKIAVAVSGGPDSMALVFLLKKWIKIKNGKLIALIVDHNLRKESNLEARTVKLYLDKHNINSKIFKIKKNYISKKNMSEARENRFQNLIKTCTQFKILHLFLGHHFDDNIETFLLRKIAGSNIEGLNAMQLKVDVNTVQILRPLLPFNKIDIVQYNKINKIFYVNDPTNENIKYSRVVVRNFALKKKNFKKKIINDFKKIQFFYPFYKKMIFQIFNHIVIDMSSKNILIDSEIFFKLDLEIQKKIIETIYRLLSPHRDFLRSRKIENLIDLLDNKILIKTNIGGMFIKKDAFLIRFDA